MVRLIVLLIGVFVLAASSSISSARNLDESVAKNARIVGGRFTDISKHPHQISLRRKKCQTCAFEHVCGGNIITEKIILTAAHCVFNFDPKVMQVVAGTNERTGHGAVVPVKNYVHPVDYYETTQFDNDIAILVLDGELPLNGVDIKPIKMTNTRPQPDDIVQVTGWGQIAVDGPESDILREVEVPIISNDFCDYLYGGGRINNRMLCASTAKGGTNACMGDSGGPLVLNDVLVGVVSWGIGCADPHFPAVYASVADLRPWIESIIKMNS